MTGPRKPTPHEVNLGLFEPSPSVQLLGWVSSAVLLLTLSRQVYGEWRAHSSKGVSRWLFLGQISASIGFTAYSLLLRNWVFAVSNAGILVVAIIGQIIFQSQQTNSDGTHR